MKKFLSAFCVLTLLLGSAGCASNSTISASDLSAYSGSTVAVKVTAMDGTDITVEIGELTAEEKETEPEETTDTSNEQTAASDKATDAGTPPEKPDGDTTGDTTGEPPALPNGETGNQTMKEGSVPDGNAPQGQAPEGQSINDNNAQGQNGTVPEKPEGDNNNANNTTGEPPEMPNGEAANSEMNEGEAPSGDAPQGEMPSAQTFTSTGISITLDLSTLNIEGIDGIEVGDILNVTFGDDATITSIEIVEMNAMGGEMPGGNGNSSFGATATNNGSAANTIDTDGTYEDVIYASDGDDENALLIDGATVTLNNITVNKNGGSSSNTESGDFYGVNAALLATNGATVNITNATVTSDAQNGNGVFSYGSGTTVNISDSVITTSADNSGGIQTTGGGTTNATNLTIETLGNSSAAIRSDRGGGTVNVDEGTYTTDGYNSPAVYSTATITVSDATLTANNSEALVIEGQNSITLYDCEVSGNMSDTKGSSSDENVHNVMIYQSMSGDAEVGTSTFSMTNGSLTSNNGDMFYITNTNCVLTLTNVTLTNKDSSAYLMRVVGNSASHGWGNAGSNGANVTFTASSQTMEGDIVVDTISTLNLTLSDSSTFTGTINIIDNAEGGTAVSDNAVVTIESGSTWTLTGDCTITSLTNNGTINFNGYTITLQDGTVLSK